MSEGAENTTVPAASAEVPEQIREFGHYFLLKQLGKGAQGVVYLAEDRKFQRKVALKMLSSQGVQSSEARQRFQREAQLTSKLDHPGICGILDFGELESVPYIAMQYVHGTPLSDLIAGSTATRAAADVDESSAAGSDKRDTSSFAVSLGSGSEMQDVVRLIERAARALHVAHEAGLIHRDIKPGNIMVTPNDRPVLLDFGLARDLGSDEQTLTQSGQIMGTPAYLAPEQIQASREKIDRRTDVYALGVALYECLTLQRPFDEPTWDKLFHSILSGVPPNPCKLNPQIPQPLATVIETAMERELSRRYQTALALAEDLWRVRSFEPIVAKAAGPITRARKWAKRRPAAAASVVAAVVFALAGGGYAIAERITRSLEVKERLASAETLLESGDHSRALETVAQARELDPSSIRALELKTQIEAAADAAVQEMQKTADLADAAAARDESAHKLKQFAAARKRIDELASDLERERETSFLSHASEAKRGAFARKETEIRRLAIEVERLAQEAEEALDRAARLESLWGGPSPLTEAAFAEFYLDRWRVASASGDAAKTAWYRSAVERHDGDGRHRGELLGRGTLTVSVSPTDAELHLFRYVSYETLRSDDPIPRLVPVPTSGVGVVREGPWVDGFHPGDPCLVVTDVAAESLAARSGLQRGDLIVRLNGQPCNGLFVREVPDAGPLADAGVAPLARILALNGVPVESGYEFRRLPPRPDGEGMDRITFSGSVLEADLPRSEVRRAPAETLIEGGADAQIRLLCLCRGEPVELSVEAGKPLGVHCELTAYPLIISAHNRIAGGKTLSVDPGSYLLVAQRQSHEIQRFPVAVPRGGAAQPALALLEVGATPPGFVWIPPGPVQLGGDPRAKDGEPGTVADVPGFLIARHEVTNEDWFSFVNSPAAREAMAKETERTIYLPRDADGTLLARKQEDGTWTWRWDENDAFNGVGATPVGGVSWQDVRDYLEWRNARAEAAGEPWIYDLPTGPEWEKAARGADGRGFPWGDRFDFSLAVSVHRKWRYLLDVPGGFEVRDESPFGVRDMAGWHHEWIKDANERIARPTYWKRGGRWSAAEAQDFRVASRLFGDETSTDFGVGFRLVLRPRR